jgi:hypothetical protein
LLTKYREAAASALPRELPKGRKSRLRRLRLRQALLLGRRRLELPNRRINFP